tara:strand:+ start:23 stop:1180 length:1158 start_codon:yes stop_codon:yes gene_type:complete
MPKLSLKSRIIGHGEEAPDNLTANPLNFRRHPKEQLNALRGSMKELGWIKTVIVNKRSGYVLDGHARVEEAIRQGLPSIPVTYVDLDENEEKLALAVLDPITELAYRDDETLKLLLDQANASDQDLKDFLLTLNNQEAESGLLPSADEDEVPEPPKQAITKLGDLIILGNHRLLCGDATKTEDVEKLMDGARAAISIADPPYNVGYQYNSVNDQKGIDEYRNFCMDFMDNALSHAPLAVVSCGKTNEHFYRGRTDFRDYLVWNKKFGLSHGSFYRAMVTEPILIHGEKPKGKFYPTDCIEVMTDREPGLRGLHTCPKPVALWERMIEPMTETNDVVLEMFGGSGTIFIACEKTGRTARALEIDPIYCDVIIQRWEKATGKKAQRV